MSSQALVLSFRSEICFALHTVFYLQEWKHFRGLPHVLWCSQRRTEHRAATAFAVLLLMLQKVIHLSSCCSCNCHALRHHPHAPAPPATTTTTSTSTSTSTSSTTAAAVRVVRGESLHCASVLSCGHLHPQHQLSSTTTSTATAVRVVRGESATPHPSNTALCLYSLSCGHLGDACLLWWS